MMKKIVIGSVVACGLGVLLVPSFFSHVGHAVGTAREKLGDQFPVEYELQRAEAMVRDIGPQVEKAKHAVAEEQVEIGYLEEEITRLEKRIGDGERKVKLQNATLKTGEASYTFAGRTIGRSSLENELRLSFDQLRNDTGLVSAKRKLLDARAAALSASIQKLEVVRGEDGRMRANIENLRARLRQTQALEAVTSHMTLDDGALAQAKEILERCRRRIDVATQMVENDGRGPAAMPSEIMANASLTTEVDRWFTPPAPAAAASSAASEVLHAEPAVGAVTAAPQATVKPGG